MDDFLNFNLNDKKGTLKLAVAIQAFLCIPFAICAFVVANTANAGFNVVLTSLLNAGFVAGAGYVLNNSGNPVAIGFLLGCSTMMTMLSLMTAVYWGQLSKCEDTTDSISQYTCSNRIAYGAVSTFATLLFIVQLIFTGAMIQWRAELIDEIGAFDDTSQPTLQTSSIPGSSYDANVSYKNSFAGPLSADL